jgi:hypothetical protein
MVSAAAGVTSLFGAPERIERRKKLLNVANRYKFSYPGYIEIFTGYPDTNVNSNDKIKNPNTNALEFIAKQHGFHRQIAVFTSWDVFPYILNTWRNSIYVSQTNKRHAVSGRQTFGTAARCDDIFRRKRIFKSI